MKFSALATFVGTIALPLILGACAGKPKKEPALDTDVQSTTGNMTFEQMQESLNNPELIALEEQNGNVLDDALKALAEADPQYAGDEAIRELARDILELGAMLEELDVELENPHLRNEDGSYITEEQSIDETLLAIQDSNVTSAFMLLSMAEKNNTTPCELTDAQITMGVRPFFEESFEAQLSDERLTSEDKVQLGLAFDYVLEYQQELTDTTIDFQQLGCSLSGDIKPGPAF